ncbi:hypothetical protein GGS23DRAFT_599220 [Durotheca rogersii]|uniref:uncharacterized protein n=1 Tax=Durotheca rogersii TaxID=419775 RepID=UPI00221F7E3D|nr:uncharacterized protein GGS23DRAFT_599220 [Durotheca rogersii]KAI5860700.1 hypothetical protein GGS23DRAFT_599220 [Durotheca rogersii]
MVLRKHELEAKLKDELDLVKSGTIRDENPLDLSAEFDDLLQACRRGDLKRTQELISAGVNINGKDNFDYTPLIIASLCGHYELVELLLESGALAERDTFQGERCIYNALNDKIRNLLLRYDYSKSTDPLQPWAAHISTLLSRDIPRTYDITMMTTSEPFELHKFLLSARSPYFQKKLAEAPDSENWKLPQAIPAESFRVVTRYLYLGDIPRDLVDSRSGATEDEVLTGIDKVSKQLEIDQLWEAILAGQDRRLARQRHQDEVNRAQRQIQSFFQDKVLGHKMAVDTRKVHEVKWSHGNSIFADCLLRADEGGDEEGDIEKQEDNANGIPIGPFSEPQKNNTVRKARKSVLYPVHKAMLIRSPYFETMFSSQFLEAQASAHLHIIKVDCSPEILEIILTFLYTEKVEFPLELGLDLLYASDMLLLDKVKTKAAALISTLGSGNNSILVDRTHVQEGEVVEVEVEPINIYDVIHAAWDLRVQRLEEFAARYIAYRLEDYIDEEEFTELIHKSASRLKTREETDTIELLDDIRYYLSERFRLRFEDSGLGDIMDLKKADSDTAPETDVIDTSAKQGGVVRTLDGNLVEDEFASDAINYQLLLQKIDQILEKLKLDA